MGNVEYAEIEATFKQAPEPSYKLVRLVNPVGIGCHYEIRSLSHALVILGRRQLLAARRARSVFDGDAAEAADRGAQLGDGAWIVGATLRIPDRRAA